MNESAVATLGAIDSPLQLGGLELLTSSFRMAPGACKSVLSDSMALEEGLRFCLSNQLSGDADDAGP